MPQLDDLYFKNEYIDAASSRARVTALPFILYLIIRFVGFICLTWSVFVLFAE